MCNLKATIFAACLVFVASSPAQSQGSRLQMDARKCMAYEAYVGRLQQDFGEAPKAIGVTSNGMFAWEFWVNEQTGTWTSIVVPAESPRIACELLHGHGVEMIMKEAELGTGI